MAKVSKIKNDNVQNNDQSYFNEDAKNGQDDVTVIIINSVVKTLINDMVNIVVVNNESYDSESDSDSETMSTDDDNFSYTNNYEGSEDDSNNDDDFNEIFEEQEKEIEEGIDEDFNESGCY